MECFYASQRSKVRRYVTTNGYVMLCFWDGKRHIRRLEHRVVMERMLGRPLLKVEHVHHGPGGRQDNSPGNLRMRLVWKHGPGQELDDLIARYITDGMPCRPDGQVLMTRPVASFTLSIDELSRKSADNPVMIRAENGVWSLIENDYGEERWFFQPGDSLEIPDGVAIGTFPCYLPGPPLPIPGIPL